MLYIRLLDRPNFRNWIYSAAGQRRAHHCQIAAIHHHRALLKIELERLFDLLTHHAKVEHQVADGAIAMSRQSLGHEDRVVDIDFSAAVFAEHGQEPADALWKVLSLDQIGRR